MVFIDSWADELARMSEGKVGLAICVSRINPSDAFCWACLPATIKPLEVFIRVITKHVDGLDT